MPIHVSNRRTFIKKGIFFVSSFNLSRLFYRKPLPKVLLLGDSISIGYTAFVQKLLEGKATVIRPMATEQKAENCQGTTYGLQRIRDWIGNTRWDLIHFNFGLHDIKHVDPITGKNSKDPNHPQQASPKQYKKNMKQIIKILKSNGARLIFATTTPYPDRTNGPLRAPGQPEIYNRVAKKLMKKHRIGLNDLFGFVEPRMKELQRPENVHFTEAGSRALAEEVSRIITRELGL